MTPNRDPYDLSEHPSPDFRGKTNAQFEAHQHMTFWWLQGLKFRTDGT